MTTKDPADAVREAPREELLARAMETEASLLVSIVGRSVSASDVTLLRQGAAVIREQSARLAALAGAAPVAWMDSLLGGVSLPSEHVTGSDPAANGYIPLFTHAPAKAREDGVLRALPGKWRGITTNRDIEWSARKFMEGYDAALVNCANDLDAALATFAEGAGHD